ncbi:MAG TPA: murein biosynthesis integral membrane protein MurJ [Roseiflexaceae bacterium]
MATTARRIDATARGVALATLLIALGTLASRALGLVRVMAIASFFGRGPGVEAYTAAWTVPTIVYDMLISGIASAALVPVLSEYAEGGGREFARVVSSVFGLALPGLGLLAGLLAWQAPLAARLLVRSSRPELLAQTAQMVRLLLPAVLLMGMAGLATAVLYARRAFLLPACAGAILNAGIILGIVLLHGQLGVASIAVGALIGALGQLALQAPGLRGLGFQPALGLRHPAVRRVLRLSWPAVLGMALLLIGTLIDRWLASGFPAALATMQYATTLVQFPLGLVAAAVGLAVLPTLSRQAAGADETAFRRTLGMGLKLVLLLVVPAVAGLAALAGPITALLFERGAFAATDTVATATALLCYLPGLPATAVAQILIFAFYARQNTLRPNLAQGVAIVIYLLAALPLLWLTHLGFLALVLGNSAQWIGHMLLLLLLLRRDVPLRGLGLGEALGKSLLAGGLMAAAIVAIARVLPGGIPLVQIGVAGGLGALIYLAACVALRVEALEFFAQALRARFSSDGSQG